MNKTHVYNFFRLILIVIGTYWVIKNLMYFVDTWQTLHAQGVTTFYLVVCSFMGFEVLIPAIFALPYLSLFIINEEDRGIKLYFKGIAYSIVGIVASGALLFFWFVFITWIYGLLT